MKNSDGEEVTDNEFYIVCWTDKEFNTFRHAFIHVVNDTIFNYMLREYNVSAEQIEQIYKRTYVK